MHDIQYKKSLGLWLTSYDTPRCSLSPTFRLCIWDPGNVLPCNWQQASNTGSLDIRRSWEDARDAMYLEFVTISKIVYAATQFKPVAKASGIPQKIPRRRYDLSNIADEVNVL